MKKAKKIPEWKRKKVSELKKLIQEYPIIGVVDLAGLPTPQLQSIRKSLKDKIVLSITKKRLLKIALGEFKDKPNMDRVINNLNGVPALLFTKEDPFKLYKLLEKNKSNAAAKPGQIAPFDIIVHAGPTNFAPGPIISELGKLGIKTAVEGGKLAIKNDVTLVKEGKVISKDAADLLFKLGVTPMKIGLNLTLVYQNGDVYTKEVLGVSEEEYIGKVQSAAKDSVALAVEIGYAIKDTVELIVKKAYLEAKALDGKLNVSKEENLINEEAESVEGQ